MSMPSSVLVTFGLRVYAIWLSGRPSPAGLCNMALWQGAAAGVSPMCGGFAFLFILCTSTTFLIRVCAFSEKLYCEEQWLLSSVKCVLFSEVCLVGEIIGVS